MKAAALLTGLLALGLGLYAPPGLSATAEELSRVQSRLQQAAAPWCERLSERDAQGRKRCLIKLSSFNAPQAQAFSFLGDANITQGMLAALSEPELALVGGHEFAHLVLGHNLWAARKAGLPGHFVQLLESSNVPPHEHTPEDRHQLELDADRLGLFFAGLAGYPVRELAAGWSELVARLPVKPQTGDDTHPSTAVRGARLKQAAEEFCSLAYLGEILMPAAPRLQPRYEGDQDALRQAQAALPVVITCRAALSAR
jgi:Zn-dependent protease with chaperone function